MEPIHIEKWYCCLNTAEKVAYTACAAQAGPITYFILKVLFDAIWLLAVEGSASERRENFVANNGMTLTSITPEGGVEVEVYVLSPEFWGQVNEYFDESGTTCAEPCKILTFSS